MCAADRDSDRCTAPEATTDLPFGIWDVGEEPTTPEILQVDLEPAVGAARRARELVDEGCTRWQLPDLAGSASLAVTEMVNNVIAHAHTAMSVRVTRHGCALHLAVRDYSHRLPVFRGMVPPTSTGGRGLLLIDAVARCWGTIGLTDGKVVWAALLTEEEAAAEPTERDSSPSRQ